MYNFWKHIPKPQEKKRKRDEDYDKQYEDSKRERKFHESWKTGRPWLEEKDGLMFCRFCIDSRKSGNFVSGCDSMKLDAITKHAKSKQHMYAESVAKAKTQPKEKSAAAGIVRALNKDIIDKLSVMFRTVHALAIHNRPLSDFVWMSRLDEKKSDINLGTTYRNKMSAATFRNYIAESEFRRTSDMLRTNRFLCLIGDGSTDSSVQEQELWYARSSRNGSVSVTFAGVSSPEKANAEGIIACVKNIFHQNMGIEWEELMVKVVGLSCDGASVMVGCRNGVSAIMKREQPSLLTIHCMAHRLELSLKDCLKTVKSVDKAVNTLVTGLYLFYHNSPLNRSMLKRAHEALRAEGDEPLKMPTRGGGTRWIGHLVSAIENLLQSYKYIVGHLGQVTILTNH
jgi:hypothetical protein